MLGWREEFPATSFESAALYSSQDRNALFDVTRSRCLPHIRPNIHPMTQFYYTLVILAVIGIIVPAIGTWMALTWAPHQDLVVIGGDGIYQRISLSTIPGRFPGKYDDASISIYYRIDGILNRSVLYQSKLFRQTRSPTTEPFDPILQLPTANQTKKYKTRGILIGIKNVNGSEKLCYAALDTESNTVPGTVGRHLPINCNPDQPEIDTQHVRYIRTLPYRFQNIRLLLQHPASVLLVTLNLGIALAYFQWQFEPLALVESRLTEQPWRCVTGNLSHVEIWHLLLNMTSLWSLGVELEGLVLDSLEFLFFNLSSLPVITAIWYLLQKVNRYRRREQRAEDHPTIGYSGVLFALMLIATLESGQNEVCPLFFASSICFKTYTIYGWLRWSWAPVVQLVVMQVLLPRVSWTGHLAGILVGMLWHIGAIPFWLMQPAVMYPLAYVLHLVFIRRVLSPSKLLNVRGGWISMVSAITVLLSLPLLGLDTMPLILTIVYWNYAAANDILWSCGLVLCASLSILTDSMTLTSWIVTSQYTSYGLFLFIDRMLICWAMVHQTTRHLDITNNWLFHYFSEIPLLIPCSFVAPSIPGNICRKLAHLTSTVARHEIIVSEETVELQQALV